MQCSNCKSELPADARFCPECGTQVPAAADLSVNQEVGHVKGTVVGQALDGKQLPANLKSTTTQKVDSVESGGTVVGTSLGNAQQIGGQRQYGDTYNVGDINGSTGVVIGRNNQVTQGASAEELVLLFEAMAGKINELPAGPKKIMVETAVQGLKQAADQGGQVDESKVNEWVSFLAETASDALDVALATIANPVTGFGLVFKKVAERVKKEQGK